MTTSKHPSSKTSRIAGILSLFLRSIIVIGTLFILISGVVLTYQWWLNRQPALAITPHNVNTPHLNPAQRLYLQTYLNNNANALQTPVGTDPNPVTFTIELGQNASQIAGNLQAAGLLNDTQLFLNYTHFYGLDNQLEAGTFQLSSTMSTADIAIALTDARRDEVIVRFVEGWRLEQMAEHLRDNPIAQVDYNEFLAIAQRHQAFPLTNYAFLASLPPSTSLEGYLFPDTYILDAEATTHDLIHQMLTNFDRQVTARTRQQIGGQGLTLWEGLILASIIEREAVVAEERPLIARAFLNRLNQDIKLDADPTIQYALGKQPDGSWWKRPLWQVDLVLDSPYNTYLYPGLPPSPIANPGLSSIEAVAMPATSNVLFFVADCDPNAPSTHLFSQTYEEHLTNVQKCR